MNKGWQTKSLGEVCDVIGGGTPPKATTAFYSGTIPWATVRDMRQDLITETEFRITKDAVRDSATNIIPAGNVVIATRVGLGKVCLLGQDTAINQDLRGIVPRGSNILTVRYLYWWLKSIADVIVAEGTGATVQGVKLPFVKALQVPVPPLSEQQRIIGLLDECFAGIATATVTVEKNLQNVSALFESHLHAKHANKATLGDLVSIRTGKLDANAAVEDGRYPFFTCSRDIFAIDTYAFDCEAILLAGNNAVGDFNVKHYNGKFNAYQRTYVITVNDSARVYSRFLYFQLLKSLARFKSQSVGAGTKFLKLGMIKSLPVELPSLNEQRLFASKMERVREETQRIAHIYELKLGALQALKKSLLHQAFSGQLTAAA